MEELAVSGYTQQCDFHYRPGVNKKHQIRGTLLWRFMTSHFGQCATCKTFSVRMETWLGRKCSNWLNLRRKLQITAPLHHTLQCIDGETMTVLLNKGPIKGKVKMSRSTFHCDTEQTKAGEGMIQYPVSPTQKVAHLNKSQYATFARKGSPFFLLRLVYSLPSLLTRSDHPAFY